MAPSKATEKALLVFWIIFLIIACVLIIVKSLKLADIPKILLVLGIGLMFVFFIAWLAVVASRDKEESKRRKLAASGQ